MRYAIHFTPTPNDPLTQAAAAWLGRDAYSGQAVEPPGMIDLGMQEISYHTALPRRYGFHGTIKAPFRLAEGHSEAALLRDLMYFSGKQDPFTLPQLVVARHGNVFSLVPSAPAKCCIFSPPAWYRNSTVTARRFPRRKSSGRIRTGFRPRSSPTCIAGAARM